MGGAPIIYDRSIVSINKIARIINEFKTKTKNVYPDVEFVFELVGDNYWRCGDFNCKG